jgi:hypothetical protein
LTALIGAIAVAVAVHGGSATTVTLLLGLGIGAAAARAALIWADAHHRHLFPLTLEKRVALLLVGLGRPERSPR